MRTVTRDKHLASHHSSFLGQVDKGSGLKVSALEFQWPFSEQKKGGSKSALINSTVTSTIVNGIFKNRCTIQGVGAGRAEAKQHPENPE